MSGLFGGYLSLVNMIGGTVLYVLVGSLAWKESDAGRNLRLTTGAIVFGAVLGMVAGALTHSLTDYHMVNLPPAWIMCGLVGIVVSCAITLGLNAIDRALRK